MVQAWPQSIATYACTQRAYITDTLNATEVPITQFRREIFELVTRALHGEAISVTYKGECFRIVPETAPATRFDRVTTMQIVNPDMPDLDDPIAKKATLDEMEKAWEEDWATL